ncbi:MAG: ChaN family lipoprotein [Desulfosalsimonadaceae bacterium]
MTVHLLCKKYAPKTGARCAALICFGLILYSGCAVSGPAGLSLENGESVFPPGKIIRTATCSAIDFDRLIADLGSVPIVYVGERHSMAADHEIQLRIAEALHAESPGLCLGLEMVDHSYQPILDQWSSGEISESCFIEKTHWHANWKHDFDLYREIFLYIRQEGIALVGLNIPPHIPPKIAGGGIDSLRSAELSHLPDSIDTSNKKHRAYVKEVFQHHKHRPGLNSFAHFYAAQCVWEDAMAEAIVKSRNQRPMLVIAGAGHLRHRYGIPARAYKRKPAKYRIVLPMPAGRTVSPEIADYIWVTESQDSGRPHMP